MKPTKPVPQDLFELVQKTAPPEADVVPLSWAYAFVLLSPEARVAPARLAVVPR